MLLTSVGYVLAFLMHEKQEWRLSPKECASIFAISLRQNLATSRESRRYVVCLHPFCGWRHLATSRESKAHLAFPGYAPWTIAVNVTRFERGFNACKTPRCIQPFLRYSKLLVENCDIFIPDLCLAAHRGWSRRNYAKILIYTKLEWMAYRVVKKAWQSLT